MLNLGRRNIFLIILLGGFALFYLLTTGGQEVTVRKANVTAVIDGDTVVVDSTQRVRLMGIDSTEVGSECYNEAKDWLTQKINGTEVRMEIVGQGTYNRNLSYIFYKDANINKMLVRRGLAYTHYFDLDGKYTSDLIDAERESINKNTGCLWEENISDPEESIYACEAGDYVSEVKVVEGRIEEVNSNQRITYLNFEGEYPDNCFTGIVWKNYKQRFPKNLSSYENKTVRIEGLITTYDGNPQIELRDAAQVEIL